MLENVTLGIIQENRQSAKRKHQETVRRLMFSGGEKTLAIMSSAFLFQTL